MTAAELAVSAPARVHERVRAAGDGELRVVHRGAHAVYVALPVDGREWCVGLVGAFAVAVPCALRTTLPALSPPGRIGHRAFLRSGVLQIDGTALRMGRVVDAGVPDLRGRPARPGVLPEPSPELAALLRLADALPGEVQTSAELVGRGSGLTPLGDDVLCGWLAVHRAYGVPTPDLDAAVTDLRDRTTLLSATLLDCAAHGEVIPEFAAWLRVLGTSAQARATAELAALGHTSGAGLLHGGSAALRHLAVSGAWAA